MNSSQLALRPESKHMETRLDDSLFSQDNCAHYMQLAGKLASSEFVPKSFRGKPSDLFICWELGYQIGMTPAQSMQCIAVINGRPAMWGDDMLALCMAHKDFEDIIEEPIINKDGAVTGYSCTVKRKDRANKVNTFTLDMAKKAGLLAKGVWSSYPERMLKLRARGFSLRDAFPDALKGIKPREEVNDYIDAEYTTVDDPTLSRAELLKKDYLTKTGKLNDEPIESIATEIHPVVGEETAKSEESKSVDSDGKKTDHLHSEIKRLIAEKGFTEQRLDKALKYYEVASIEELTNESSEHLFDKLNKI